jgi:hypothetical protein
MVTGAGALFKFPEIWVAPRTRDRNIILGRGGCDFVVWIQLAQNWSKCTDIVRVVIGIRIALKLRTSSSE